MKRHISIIGAFTLIAAAGACAPGGPDDGSTEHALERSELEQRDWIDRGESLWNPEITARFAILLVDEEYGAGVYGYNLRTGALDFAFVAAAESREQQRENIRAMEQSITAELLEFPFDDGGAGFLKPKGPGGGGPVGEPGPIPENIVYANQDAVEGVRLIVDSYRDF